ncbi:MAG: hypothetical protein HW421_439 [Ignavibacteria bacterium]|nr:hypothetical protein [Ignavibacteria bacterium]
MMLKKIFVLTIFTVLLNGCTEEHSPKRKAEIIEKIGSAPDQVSWDIKVSFIDSSYLKAVLWAKKSRIYNERAETLLDDSVRVEFISKETGETETYLWADSARVDDKTRDMLARGNVLVINKKTNRRLVTKLLLWDNRNQKLYSNEYVKINSPVERLEGWGFESDQNLNNYKIFKVSGVRK